MTTALAKNIHTVLGTEVGSHYPGPVPMQPVGVTLDGSNRRIIQVCAVATGFAELAKTHKPGPFRTESATVPMELINGTWLVDSVTTSTVDFCKSVKVAAPKW